jgi:hypothetical protein
MIRIYKILFLIAISFTLVGCATRSLELSNSDKAAFYNPPKDKTLASLYLTCGRNAVDGEYGKWNVPDETGNCVFEINNIHYSAVFKDEVGRVDIPAGKFTLNNSNGQDATKILEATEGEKMLLVTDMNIIQQPGASFGLLGMAAAAIIKANSPPEKELHAPLTIYKNDFMNKISMKQPVKVFPIENK